MKNLFFSIILTGVFCLPVFSGEVNISSPDGKFQMKVYDRSGNLWYTVNYGGKPIVLESQLGINGNGEWKDGMSIDR